ncbi:MAG: hypothetical protein OER21_00205 [Gemmatimonadota bacterium]|nr:hypothetical protein [Gemmatimonadota bacterium]
MAKVSELKERARALEQQGAQDKALAVYRHILTHLERTPAIRDELALYVKVGDLSLKLGDTTTAIAMYEEAADHYARAGSDQRVIALCVKLLRVAPGRWDAFRVSVERLLEHGHVHAAHAVLTDYARRAKLPHLVVGLQPYAGRPDAEVRAGVTAMLAELDQTPPAESPDERAAAGPDDVLEVTRDVSPGSASIPTPPASRALPERLPAPPPVPPNVHAPPPVPPKVPTPPPALAQPSPLPPRGPQVGPPPRQRVAPPPTPRVERPPAPRAATPPAPRPAHPAPPRTRQESRAAVGKVFLTADRRRRDRRPAIAVAAVVVITGAAVAAYMLGLPPFGSRGESAQGGQPPPRPVPRASAPADSLRAETDTALVPTNTLRTLAQPETALAAVPAPPPVTPPGAGETGRAAPDPAADRTAPSLPRGAMIISGLPIVSVTQVPAGGRPAFRIVQRLPSGETVALSALPLAAGTDTTGVGQPEVTAATADTSAGRVRFWSYLVNARGRVEPDTLEALLRRLVRAEAR